MASRALRTFQLASAASRLVPLSVLSELAGGAGGRVGPRLMPAKADQLARHQQRTRPGIEPDELKAAVRRGFGSYARYWAESFRLPALSARKVDRGFSVVGFDRVQAVLDSGIGPILVLPHLGGWEWAAAWLSRVVGVKVTAVVERVEPAEVFDWFVDLRQSYGIEIIPLGPDALAKLVRSVKAGNIVCLLSDRDISGRGVEVRFFGERTTLPAGPALLARRTGSPLLPTAVYFRRRNRIGYVSEPILASSSVPVRADVERVTQDLATAMERLIAVAPDQWHLLEPNWPSDRRPPVVTGDPAGRDPTAS
jgi:KDO2-lipid IV(A) lauroyltransferase